MVSKFIKLTVMNPERPILFNINNIITVFPNATSTTVEYMGDAIQVKESFLYIENFLKMNGDILV